MKKKARFKIGDVLVAPINKKGVIEETQKEIFSVQRVEAPDDTEQFYKYTNGIVHGGEFTERIYKDNECILLSDYLKQQKKDGGYVVIPVVSTLEHPINMEVVNIDDNEVIELKCTMPIAALTAAGGLEHKESVLIRGFERPNNCYECPFVRFDYEKVVEAEGWKTTMKCWLTNAKTVNHRYYKMMVMYDCPLETLKSE